MCPYKVLFEYLRHGGVTRQLVQPPRGTPGEKVTTKNITEAGCRPNVKMEIQLKSCPQQRESDMHICAISQCLGGAKYQKFAG